MNKQCIIVLYRFTFLYNYVQLTVTKTALWKEYIVNAIAVVEKSIRNSRCIKPSCICGSLDMMHNAILGGQVRSCQNWIWMKTRKQRWLLAFKKINQNTQDVKKWMAFNVDKTKQCEHFQHTLPLTLLKKQFNCNLQQWHSAKCLIMFWCCGCRN